MRLSKEEIKQYDRKELLEIKADIELRISEIKDQIKNYDGSDPDWLRRAKFALKKLGQEYQIITLELCKRNDDLKKSNIAKDKLFERRFIDICKNRLDSALFEEIKLEALSGCDSVINPYA